MDNKIIVLDGGMGTMLQAAGMPAGQHPEVFGHQHPEIVEQIHRQYIEAGSDVIYANTFGANARKLQGCSIDTGKAIFSAIRTAKRAVQKAAKETVRVALDLGPVGELLEPLGTLSFEEAYEIYREAVVAGYEAGADLIVAETFTDLLDIKALVLAAKENTPLPVWTTMTFERSGRTFTGTTIASMALTLTGLGVDAVGINCSLGPTEILPLIEELREWTHLPVIAKPNAGLPDPRTGVYDLTAEDFGKQMQAYAELGVSVLGGCCGTDPDYIRCLVSRLREAGYISGWQDLSQASAGADRSKVRKGICSTTNVCEFGGVRVIGERINPTGKKRFQQALREHDMEYICKMALDEEEAGADLLDVNVGLPGAEEKPLMLEVVRALQGVVSVPLQIDSSDPEVIEAALRIYAGKAIINSVNADDAKLAAILPVARKYGAAVIGLALDEGGIPQTAQERFEKAAYIKEKCLKAGMEADDIIIDALTLTVSAQQEQARETLEAVERISRELGLHTALGVSNISFGLPAREHVTENFLIQAMYCGLDFPIINPNILSLMDAVASFKVLSGEDISCMNYIDRFAGRKEIKTPVSDSRPQAEPAEGAVAGDASNGERGISDQGKSFVGLSGKKEEDPFKTAIDQAILKGLKQETRNLAEGLLEQGLTEVEVINRYLIPALDLVGDQYEKQTIFLPQLINSANAASAAFDMIKDRIAARGQGASGKEDKKIVVCTVKGDIHDIGKNIVKVILENYGYKVFDLGRDVPAGKVVDTVVAEDVRLVGLSALMTTTLPAMQETIDQLREASPHTKVWVGGAVLTREYAREIGADFYADDARESVEIAQRVLGEA